MQTFNGTQSIKTPIPGSVVTLGNFDGVHLGHRELISKAVASARSLGVPAVVFTFDPHPIQVLAPDRPFRRLFAIDDLKNVLPELGVDVLVVEPFTHEFARQAAGRFFEESLWAKLQPKQIVVGPDFAFGRDRSGDVGALTKFGTPLGVDVRVVPSVTLDGEAVSSSRIRQALVRGEVAEASRLLGRPFYVVGDVTSGAQRGRSLGFPTANIVPSNHTLSPRSGVYATKLCFGDQCYPSVTNIGINPTFQTSENLQPLSIETHILDKDMNLYGKTVKIMFYSFLREEKKFSSVEALMQQIEGDIEVARELLKTL